MVIQAKDAKIHSFEKQVSDLELQIRDIEQYGRQNSLRIIGIQETASQDVKEKVSELINDTVQVNPKVMDQHIDRVHRVGKGEFKREKKIEDCWSWEVKILFKNKVSKVILIRTVEDLEKEASRT